MGKSQPLMPSPSGFVADRSCSQLVFKAPCIHYSSRLPSFSRAWSTNIGILGTELTDNMRKQSLRFGTRIFSETVNKVGKGTFVCMLPKGVLC